MGFYHGKRERIRIKWERKKTGHRIPGLKAWLCFFLCLVLGLTGKLSVLAEPEHGNAAPVLHRSGTFGDRKCRPVARRTDWWQVVFLRLHLWNYQWGNPHHADDRWESCPVSCLCRTWTAGCFLSPACLKIPQTVLNHRKTGSVESQLFSGHKIGAKGLVFLPAIW